MPNLVIRPITHWPWPQTKNPRPALFKVAWDQTIRELEIELDHIGADGAIIELACKDTDLRITGTLKDGVRLAHQGVVLSCTSKHGPMRYPCDTFTEWRKNVRAIGLSLTALRAVDRYGVTTRGEQYRGFTALPAPPPAGSMTPNDAAKFLCEHSDEPFARVIQGGSWARSAYLKTAAKLHPDKGGDAKLYGLLPKVKAALEIG